MLALQFKPLMFLGIELTRSCLIFPTFFISGKFLGVRCQCLSSLKTKWELNIVMIRQLFVKLWLSNVFHLFTGHSPDFETISGVQMPQPF